MRVWEVPILIDPLGITPGQGTERTKPMKTIDEALRHEVVTYVKSHSEAKAEANKSVHGVPAGLEFPDEEWPHRGTTLAHSSNGSVELLLGEAEDLSENPVLSNSKVAGELCSMLIGRKTTEHFLVMFMTSSGRLIRHAVVAKGGPDGVATDSREIAKLAILLDASNVICAHNHPNSIPLPSNGDVEALSGMANTLMSIGVQLFDSIVVSGDAHYSMRGYMTQKYGGLEQAMAALSEKASGKKKPSNGSGYRKKIAEAADRAAAAMDGMSTTEAMEYLEMIAKGDVKSALAFIAKIEESAK